MDYCIDSYDFEEFPYYCEFYVTEVNTDSKPSEMTGEQKLIYSTKCDIQESSKSMSGSTGFISTTHNVYLPFNMDEEFPIKKGCTFKGYMYGLEITGKVVGIYPTQFGKATIYIQEF